MRTNHNCSSIFLELILGSNIVCLRLLSLTVLILEEAKAFFLHLLCSRRGGHAHSIANLWEREFTTSWPCSIESLLT